MNDKEKKQDFLKRLKESISSVLASHGYEAEVMLETDPEAELTETHWLAYDRLLKNIEEQRSWSKAIHKSALKNGRDDMSQFELTLDRTIEDFLCYDDGPHFLQGISFSDLRRTDTERMIDAMEQSRKVTEQQSDRILEKMHSSSEQNRKVTEQQADRILEMIHSSSEQNRNVTEQQSDRILEKIDEESKQTRAAVSKEGKRIRDELKRDREQTVNELKALREELHGYDERLENLFLSAVPKEDAKVFYRSQIKDEFIRILQTAEKELMISTPWIHGWYRYTEEGRRIKYGYYRYRPLLIDAVKRGVRIHLAYGWNGSEGRSGSKNRSSSSKDDNLNGILTVLKESVGDRTDRDGCYLEDQEKICLYEGDSHIKCVIMDNSYMLFGSCNLLSSDPAEESERKRAHAEIMISCSDEELIRQVRQLCLEPGQKLIRIRRPEEIGTYYVNF